MLFVGALYASGGPYGEAVEMLAEAYGPLFFETLPMPWRYSDYYASELGSPLMRSFAFFGRPVPQEALRDIKLATIDIESGLSASGRRTVNLDPGCLTLSRVVLASTKDYAHRVYIGRGIYAEVTLVFRGGTFEPHVFTYRDYADASHIALFNGMRGAFKRIAA